MSSDSDSTYSTTPNKQLKYAKRNQKYRKSWETTFKWLNPVDNDPYSAYCKACKSNIKAHLSILRLHDKSKKHMLNIKGNQKQRQINTLLQVPKIPNNVSSVEIKLAGFVSEHNLSFSIIDYLTNLLKESVTDSN